MSTPAKIDLEKFSRYSRPGPRYTSYPTALEFSDAFGYEDYIKALESEEGPLSIYVHLPFCRSACYFCGCNVVFTSKEEKLSEYIGYLKREIDLLAKHVDTGREVIQFHFGGGPPPIPSLRAGRDRLLYQREVSQLERRGGGQRRD